jgi:cobalt-zinc-cadmium efflux system outer membrane protein
VNKTILCIFLLSNLYAKDYNELLELAINNSINLELIKNQQTQISLNGEIERRYDNPNLEIEVADFSNQFITDNNSFGIRVGVSQSIPLPHIQQDRESITQSQIYVSQKQYQVEKSNFIYRFNLKYLLYKKAKKLLELQEEEIALAQEILNTVNSRYKEGSVAKSDYLEAQLEYKKAESRKKDLQFQTTKAKSDFLTFTNITTQEYIDSNHLFTLTQNSISHPVILLSESRTKESQAKIELLQHSIDSIELFSELESEPDQDVFRVGVSIALPTFNTNSQERQLEKINIANQRLLSANQNNRFTLQIEQLIEQNSELAETKESYQSLIASQEQLFDMYSQSYTIGKVNLLKLQQIKQQRVVTKEKILESNFTIEQNNIKINYLQGAYSE